MTLPEGWKWGRLGDLVDVLDGRRVPVSATERLLRPGLVPYYGAAGRVGRIDKALFDEDLVLLGEDGVQFFDPLRVKAYRVRGPSWVNNHAHVLRARSTIDWHFLTHYLNHFDYRGYANGTTRLKLTQAAMKRIPVRLPLLDEQRRIVEILEEHLSSLDSGNANLDVAEKRLDRMIAAELSMLTANSAPVALKDLTLEATYGTSTKCIVGGPGPKVIRIPNIVGGRVDLADEKRAVDSEVDLRALMVREGDLLIIRTNGSRNLIGRSGVIDGPLDASFASYLIRYRLKRDRVRPAWLQRALGLPRVRREIERLAASSAGQYNLSLGKLAGLELPVPNLAKQDAWLEASVRLEDAVADQRRMLGIQRRRSAALRRALLEAAFSGRLTGRASDLDRAEEAIAS